MSIESARNLPLKAKRLSLRNMYEAFMQSPLGAPGFRIGRVVDANTVRVGNDVITIDDPESKIVLDYDTKVVIYRQGESSKKPASL